MVQNDLAGEQAHGLLLVVSRRLVVMLLLGALAAAVLLVFLAPRCRRWYLRRTALNKVGPLKLPEAVINAYVDDFIMMRDVASTPKFYIASAVLLVFGSEMVKALLSGTDRRRLQYFEEDLPRGLMLSTDYFVPGRIGEEIKYVSFHDPYIAPCSNILTNNRNLGGG